MNSQAAKRYACDRCREQKLKCSRSQPIDNSACERCLRLGATCATGSGRPLGRPPMEAYSSSSGGSARVATHGGRRGSTAHRTARIRTTAAPEAWIRGTTAGDVGHTSTTDSTTTTKQPQAPLPPILSPAQTQSDNQSSGAETSQYFHSAPQAATGVVNTGQRATSVPSPSNELEDPTAPGWYEYNGVKDVDFEDLDVDFDFRAIQDMNEPLDAHHSPQPPTSDAGDDFGRGQRSMSANGDSAVFIIGMLASLAPQLAELRNQPWDLWNPHNHVMRTAFFHGPDLMGDQDLDLWNKTISVITRFAMVMQMMSTAPSTTLPTTLVLLSSYIQLAELISIILERIYCCLNEGQGSKTGLPNVAMAHHVTRSTNVQILTMMMQNLGGQLQAVERLMGLPDDCRFWDQGNAETGLLPQDKFSELVQAIMGEARGTFQSVKHNRERIQTSLKYHNAN